MGRARKDEHGCDCGHSPCPMDELNDLRAERRKVAEAWRRYTGMDAHDVIEAQQELFIFADAVLGEEGG